MNAISTSVVIPACQAGALSEIFAQASFQDTALPNMAVMANPADGFAPARLPSGTEVLWVSKPEQLGPALAPRIAPIWNNGLGLILYRNEQKKCMGSIFLHGAMKTPWSAHGPGAWHALGGVMAFSGASFEDAIEMVVSKGYAMTPKWRFIDMSLEAAGHPTLTHLGGGKAIVVHGPTDADKENGVIMSAEVADALGIYISGPDQNMDDGWCGKYAARAPRNFVGSYMAEGKYRGMKPSKHTARAVFRGIGVVCEELIGGRPPIFFEGYGGVGKVMVARAVEEGFPISGLADIVSAPLLGVKKCLPSIPLFLNAAAAEANFGPERRAVEETKARENGITVVSSLVEALEFAPDTKILSPNAGPHPVTERVAEYLIAAGIRAVVGAANNMLAVVDGSPEAVARRLLNSGIFVPNDSRINRIGALACMIDIVGLDRSIGLALQIRQVGEDVRKEISAYRRNIPPQIFSDELAASAWNLALSEGRAIGGHFSKHVSGGTEDL